jgi:hypothetical protein
MNVNRRQFLSATGATVSGLGVLGSVGTVAAASTPYITTRDHFDDDGNLTAGHTQYDYGTSGDVPGVDTGCDGDVTVFIHGWDKKSSESDADQAALDKMAEADTELTNAGYSGTVVGMTWDNDKGGGWDYGWGVSQDIAQQTGIKLAQFAVDFKYYCPNATLRFTSHSLGAQVLFNAVRVLDDSSWWDSNGHRIRSIHPFGAATDNEVPTTEDRETYDAIYNEVGEAHNYYNAADDVLQWVYNSIEFDQALGETGIESGNTAPPNYTDHDVESQVGDDHSNYLATIADDIVRDMP